jgi:O-antigen/teichoic acid export membrane protein
MKTDVIANFVTAIWVGVLTFFFTPIYVRNLGVEAYGLIGLLAALQTSLGLFDLALNQVLAREISRHFGGAVTTQSIRNLIRSVEVVAIVIAVLAALAVALPANWIASTWLKPGSVPTSGLVVSVQLMGLIIALRTLEGLYRGALIGLQRQLDLNVITVIAITARTFGSLAIFTLYSRAIEVFFLWQAVVSTLTVLLMVAVVYASLPARHSRGSFAFEELHRVSRFALGLTAVALLGVAMTQTDKLLLSTLLELGDFGRYSLAATLAAAPHLLGSPILQAVQPRFSRAIAQSDTSDLVTAFHASAQLMTVIVGAASVVIIGFSSEVLTLWLSDQSLAATLAPLVRLLAIGTLLNAIYWVPYGLQLAHGWTGLIARTNLVSVAILVPMLLIVTPLYGAMGAAAVWVALNLGFVAISAPLMFHQILKGHMLKWYLGDTAVPLMAAASVVGLAKWLAPRFGSSDSSIWVTLLGLGVTSVCACAAALAVAPLVRAQARGVVSSCLELARAIVKG